MRSRRLQGDQKNRSNRDRTSGAMILPLMTSLEQLLFTPSCSRPNLWRIKIATCLTSWISRKRNWITFSDSSIISIANTLEFETKISIALFSQSELQQQTFSSGKKALFAWDCKTCIHNKALQSNFQIVYHFLFSHCRWAFLERRPYQTRSFQAFRTLFHVLLPIRLS